MEDHILSVRLDSDAFSCEDIQISKLEGHEEISQMFRFDVEIVYLDPAGLDLEEVSGAEVALSFSRDGEEVRRVHGMICAVDDRLETEAAYRSYRLSIVPRVWRLSLIETLDVFINKTVPALVQEKIELVGLVAAFENHLSGSYPIREFIVQYKESDFAFVSRLLEHLGISFVFRQVGGEERIALIDDAASFPTLDVDVPYQGRGERTGIYRIEQRRELIPNVHVVRDYNYRSPSLELSGMRESPLGYGGGIVEYGNHAKTPEEAESFARVRTEASESRERVYHGESGVVALTAGARFHLSGHAHIEDELLLVAVTHHMTQPGMMTGGEAEAATYRNTFRAIPAARTFRPPRVTPRPRIYGFTTGIIEKPDGGAGRQPGIDAHGRYTVRFLFDTALPGERQASHPVRMAQLSSGAHYGTHFPLRPDTEVILAFLDGDPDRPIIAGSVPNPETWSPVTSSDPLKSRIRSATGIVIEFSEKT